MPSRRYHSREPVFVSIRNFTGNYGFYTNLSTGDQGELGQQGLATAQGAVIFGANRPKPPRAIKKDTGGSVSSFVDSSILGALPAGWRLSASGKASVGPSDLASTIIKSIRTFVPITASVNWAWDMPLETMSKIGQDVFPALGIELLTPASKCWYKANTVKNSGTEFSRPPRVKTTRAGEGGIDTVSTFCSPLKLDDLPLGWTPIN